jgi:cardiolipin synthase
VAHLLLSHAYAVLTAAASVLIAVHLLSTKRSSQSLLAWLIALVFLPPIAIPLYLLLGTRKVRRGKARPALDARKTESPSRPIARVLVSAGLPPPREGNSFELLADGVTAYHRLLELIAASERSIDLTIFILGDDAVGAAVLDALAAKALAGVSVRVILDGLGSRSASGKARRILAAAGGELRVFMPLFRVPTHGPANLRNHRKLAVFDAATVFLGGMNVAVEYMGPSARDDRFRDVAAIAKGPIAGDALALFEGDWSFTGKPATTPEAPHLEPAGDASLQLVASGPDLPEDALYDGLLTAISGAKTRVTMVTPYYVPDDLLQRTLLLAARRGALVELVMPSRSNHALADFARRALVRELRASGVRVLGYEKGMVHAKAMVVDDDFAFLGSPNLDMRSLYLNYESALFAYGPREVGMIAGYVEGLRDESVEGAFDLRRRWWLLEQLARLVAPEL